MAFVQAMSATATATTTKRGVNGEIVYTAEGVEDCRVPLFTMLNRGLDADRLQEMVRDVFTESKKSGQVQLQLDMFLMAFQTRDIRGGKGEKNLFYKFIKVLYELDELITTKMIRHIPEYGCWRDMWELMREEPLLTAEVMKVTHDTFMADRLHMAAGSFGKMSLLAKWLPREGSVYSDIGKFIASQLYPDIKNRKKQMMTYRKEVSAMNKALKTVEVNMCGGTWQEIDPDRVPGRCLKLHSSAFLNLKKINSVDTIRFPDSEDRMECRHRFLDWKEELKAGTKKAKGADVVMPHELVETVYSQYRNSEEEKAITQAQWESIREKMAAGGAPATAVTTGNTSGMGSKAPVPPGLGEWNWGGFLLTWIWGIGNNVWIALVALGGLIPYVGWIISIVMAIILGIRGNEWAWQNKKWESIEHFRKTQRSWMWWGIGMIILQLALLIAVTILIISLIMIISTSGLGRNFNWRSIIPWQ